MSTLGHLKETPDVSTTAAEISSRARLTIAEVCDELSISKSTFYEWRTKGVAPKCTRLPNGGIRIHRDDLELWLNSLEEAA